MKVKVKVLGSILIMFSALAASPLLAQPAPAPHSNPLNAEPLVREAYQHFYNLDYPGAIDRFQKVHAEHPGNPQATALLLNAELFEELYRQDLLDTTFYANDGFLTGKHATSEDPRMRDRILGLADQAVAEADAILAVRANDVDALYSRGWARSLKCTYLAMVQRGFGAGFRLATKARADEERVLELDPQYVDAELVVGVYQYVVGALPWPFKLVIGFVGINGDKNKGLALLRDGGARGVTTSVEARTVTALFLRREGRYPEAIEIVRGLKHEYPRNFLFCLEEANLRKDAGEGMRAVEAYQELLNDAHQPGFFATSQLELADFGLGEALRGQRHYQEAAHAYENAALSATVSPELKVRSLLAAGQCHDLQGERSLAVRDYQEAIDAGPETTRADQARKLLRSPYKGN